MVEVNGVGWGGVCRDGLGCERVGWREVGLFGKQAKMAELLSNL